MSHYQPNGRPIHPRCGMRSNDQTSRCACDLHWNYWDGSDEGGANILRAALTDERRPVVSEVQGGQAIVYDTTSDVDGFYKHSELLKCALDDARTDGYYDALEDNAHDY
jgi:hypothetical protein